MAGENEENGNSNILKDAKLENEVVIPAQVARGKKIMSKITILTALTLNDFNDKDHICYKV